MVAGLSRSADNKKSTLIQRLFLKKVHKVINVTIIIISKRKQKIQKLHYKLMIMVINSDRHGT